MHSTHSDEVFIANRYTHRRYWPAHFDYKKAKAARIGQIMAETGDLPSLALEVGVGQGGVAAAVSRQGIQVLGIDLSPDSIARARTHCRNENVTLLRASGFFLPFRSKSLEVVYASQVLHLFDTAGRSAILREVHRVLRPGSRFIFDMKNASTHLIKYLKRDPARRQRNYPSKSDITRLVRESGFSSVITRPGVLPLIHWTNVPNLGIFRILAHTTFFVATRE
jgi:ubiquinone/menaquinone biosynthesis C-methylase UbiE